MTDVLISSLLDNHPSDAAQSLSKLDAAELASFMNTVPANLASKVLRAMNPLVAARCLEHMTPELAARQVSELPLATLRGLLLRIDSVNRKRIVSTLPHRVAVSLRLLMRYPAGVVGSVMNPMVFTLSENITVDDAKKNARNQRRELLHWVFVLDGDQKLTGMVDIRDMLLATGKSLVETIMQRDVTTISDQSRLLSVAQHATWNTSEVLPVIDRKRVFLGVLHRQALSPENQISSSDSPATSPVSAILELADLFWSVTTNSDSQEKMNSGVNGKPS
ncbi:magnesium transporter MgtE N-terminal domain-containing protein [Pseudomonadota bacterium]